MPRARVQVLAEPRVRWPSINPPLGNGTPDLGASIWPVGTIGEWPSGDQGRQRWRGRKRGKGGHGKKEARIEPVVFSRMELSLYLRSGGRRYWDEPKNIGEGDIYWETGRAIPLLILVV